ncbi:hypothetical protein PIB30_093548, partial [Stylosanthes scabra]|nr:hypothetical protein [Stylosanthes scabra]
TPEEALELIELVATNQYMNFSERSTMRKGVLEVDSVNALMTQLSTINKKLEKLEASAVGTQVICGICGVMRCFVNPRSQQVYRIVSSNIPQ